MLRQIDAGERDPHHIIVAWARENDDGSYDFGQLQAGQFRRFAQHGLLAKVAECLDREGD